MTESWVFEKNQWFGEGEVADEGIEEEKDDNKKIMKANIVRHGRYEERIKDGVEFQRTGSDVDWETKRW